MNEQQLVEALEPYVEEMLDVIQRVKSLESRPLIDDDGLTALLTRMKADPAFRGLPGEPGHDAASTAAQDVAMVLKADSEFLASVVPELPPLADLVNKLFELHGTALKGEPGVPGDVGVPPTAEEVAEVLVEKYAEVLKGTPGEPGVGEHGQDGRDGEPGADGKDADPDLVAKALAADETFRQAVKGEPGADGEPGQDGANADPAEVAAILKSDNEFVSVLKGDPGPAGQDGAPGADGQDGVNGKDADPLEVAAVLKADGAFVDLLKGEPGAKGEDGKDGEAGRPGLDGAGIHAPVHEPNKVYREGATVQAFIGQHYRAKCDTAAAPGESDDWERIGTAGFRWRGLKPDEKSLKQGDIFIDGGSMFGVFEGNKANMVVQRPKNAPEVKAVEVKGDKITIKMSNGTEIVGEVKTMDWTSTIDTLNERVEVLDEALRKSEELVAKMSKSMQLMHERLQLLEENE